MDEEKRLLKLVLESASNNVKNWPDWRRSEEARTLLKAKRDSTSEPQTDKQVKADSSHDS
jgi:hypothetical protein